MNTAMNIFEAITLLCVCGWIVWTWAEKDNPASRVSHKRHQGMKERQRRVKQRGRLPEMLSRAMRYFWGV